MSLLVDLAACRDGVRRVRAELGLVKVAASDLDAAIKAGEAALKRKVKDCLPYAEVAEKRVAAEKAAKAKWNQ